MRTHAILSASSSNRWLECPPSARLNDLVQDTVSPYAKEGTEAHALCEHRLKEALEMESTDPIPHLSMYSQEMEDVANSYVLFIQEIIEGASNPQVLIEQRLDFSDFVPDGFGTGDCVILAEDTIHLLDLKFGKNQIVEAEENTQLMLYGLGCLQLFDGIYDIKKISMTIFQPRRDNISTYEVSKDELLKWAEEYVKPRAKLAHDGVGDFCAGDWCQFCKVKATCRERARANLELAKLDFALPPTLADEEIEEILGQLDDLTSWAKDIQEYALSRAKSGKRWAGFKLVEGRSNRKYSDEEKVAETVAQAGYEPYEQKLLGITAMTKLLGNKKFNELLGELVIKPVGKPTLVPESDKRPELENDFYEFMEDNDYVK